MCLSGGNPNREETWTGETRGEERRSCMPVKLNSSAELTSATDLIGYPPRRQSVAALRSVLKVMSATSVSLHVSVPSRLLAKPFGQARPTATISSPGHLMQGFTVGCWIPQSNYFEDGQDKEKTTFLDYRRDRKSVG